MELNPIFISGIIGMNSFQTEWIKRQPSWKGQPTQQPAKSLRHNETEKEYGNKVLFSVSPFGTYSVSFWLCITLSVYLLSFFPFSFGKYFFEGNSSAIYNWQWYKYYLFARWFVSWVLFLVKVAEQEKWSKKNTAFRAGFFISNDTVCPYGSGNSTFLPFWVQGRISEPYQ